MRKHRLFTAIATVTLLMVALLLTGSLPAALASASAPTAPWQYGPTTPFNFTRFDGEYSYDTGMVYFLGGRLGDGTTDGSVWSFDPATGVYTDTGVDMPTPVSNYLIAPVLDSNGDEVLMIFGGRPAAGGVVNNTQGYMPSTNTTVDYTGTDPYPVLTSPGGVAVVDNIVYSFGGFDAAQVIADTYIFDLNAPAGSRWTTGPALNLARAYLGFAVVDEIIYAMGGDTYDGATLVAQTMAEKLDTNAGVLAWDDAGVADMPVACDETPAFGFDSASNWDLAGQIVVAGCGQWSSEINEVQLYDVHSDTWDTTFEDLNDARRNHAGAFIPEGDGTGGRPGMWVWGGRQGSDTNVLNTSEYNPVTALGAFTLTPDSQQVSGFGVVTFSMGAVNNTGADDTFDLSYGDTLGWTINGPSSVAVANGATVNFDVDVTIAANATCFDVDDVTVTGTSQANPAYTDDAEALVEYFCETGIGGTIYDANTAQPLPNAYIYVEKSDDGNIYGEAFADANGDYLITGLVAGDYYLAVSAQGYQFSILPNGWPAGADVVSVAQAAITDHDKDMLAPVMALSDTSYDVTLRPNEQVTETLTIENTGTSDLFVSLGTYDDGVNPPPLTPNVGYRIDPRILSNLAESSTTDFIVVMKAQADLSAAYNIADWNVRGAYVYNTLAQTATASQLGIRNFLASQGLQTRPFIAINGLLVRGGNLETVNAVASRPDVAYLLANASIQLETMQTPLLQDLAAYLNSALSPDALTWGVEAVNADDVWGMGDTGQGIVVANIDTGVEWTHSALVNQYRGNGGDHNYNWYHPTSPAGCDGSAAPCDNDGHGSHTMGTIVGSTDPSDPANAAEAIGVAPGAEWIACKGCEANSCSFEALLTCGDWMLAPTDLNGDNPDPAQRPNVVNNSWGGGGGDFWYGGVVGAWRASGIFPQFSAGNSGPGCSTTGSPGDYASTFGAAAIDETLTVAGFSSRGPADVTGLMQPEISAPGVGVRSSLPGNGYGNLSGTSMASPHVAGVVALLWSEYPELVGQIEDTMWILSQTAMPKTTTDGCGGDPSDAVPNNTYGWGIVDAHAAVMQGSDIVVDWVAVDPAGVTVAPGDSATVNLVFTAPATEDTYEGVLQVTADEPYNPEVIVPLTLTVEVPTDVTLSNFDQGATTVTPVWLVAVLATVLLVGLYLRRALRQA